MKQSAREHTGRRVVRIVDSVLDFGILVLILLLVAFSLFAMWDSEQVRRTADPSRFEIYKPTQIDTVSFEELKAINPDVFAWLTVYGTSIDYPIVQGADNEKYVNTDVYGKYCLSGSIFMDAENDRSFRDFNSIMYGHHMEKHVMFGDIGCFCEREFFDEHLYGNLFYDGSDHGLEFFAFIHTSAYHRTLFSAGVTGTENQQQYLDDIKATALFYRDIGVSTGDRLVLLTTCSSETTNGRDILVARITDRTYIDTFAVVDEPGANLPYPFDQLYRYRACIVSVLVLLILIAIALYVTTRTRRKQ